MGRRDDTRNVVLDDQGDDVSSHPTETSTFAEWCEAYDSLLAENQRLREKVAGVERLVAAGHVADGISVSSACVIREALAGDAE